jgi:predicted esterase
MRLSARCALLLLILLCQGCGMSAPAVAPDAPEAQRFRFEDGGEAIYFTLDKSLRPAHPIETLLFVVSGSDCASMRYFLPHYFRGLEGESGPLRIFILHKRHIEAGTWGRVWGCGEDFIRDDHPRRWIADQTEFIRARLRQARAAGPAPRRIVVAGISEGAEIVPALVRSLPEITHAVILGNGGMDPIEAYRLQARRHGFAALLPESDGEMPPQRIGGRSWRYWHELRQLSYADGLLEMRIPLLVGMGEADQAVPIEAARLLQRRYAEAGKDNLLLLTYPGADHALHSPEGNRMPDFWHAVDLWLRH